MRNGSCVAFEISQPLGKLAAAGYLTYAAADGRFRHQVGRQASGILRAGIPSVKIKPPAAELGR